MKEYTIETTLDFGKHRGKTMAMVLEEDPSYIEWMCKNNYNVPVQLATDARLAFAKKKDKFIGSMLNRSRQYEEDLIPDEEERPGFDEEQAHKAMLYGSPLTYKGKGDWRIMKKEGSLYNIYEVKTGTKLMGVNPSDLWIRFKPTTNRCPLSCGPGDHRTWGKCWYMGCYNNEDDINKEH